MDTEQSESVFQATPAEEEQLLRVARAALETAVRTGHAEETWFPSIAVSERLLQDGASFVTLHVDGKLRGCIGSAQAYRPLAPDVVQNAMRAALLDPRFDRITVEELPRVEIEISILTPPTPLTYRGGPDLIDQLRPHVDGAIVVHDLKRALLLPQTWDLVSDPTEFLTALCRKAGLPGDAYLEGNLDVYTFQVRTITEPAATEKD